MRISLVLPLILILTSASCNSKPPALPEAKRYHMEGKVLEVDGSGKKLRVDHKDIKGFMDAMTMTYEVQDPTAMKTVKTGDEISADVVVARDSFWLENVKPAPASSTPQSTAPTSPTERKP